MGKRLPQEVKDRALQLHNEGVGTLQIATELGINRETVRHWIVEPYSRGNGKGQYVDTWTGGTIRKVLCMLDEGIPLKTVALREKIHPATIRRWRDTPHVREATFEYDPSQTYDINDLIDRAIVAQHLCSQVRCDGRYEDGKRERLELLFAAIDYQEQP